MKLVMAKTLWGVDGAGDPTQWDSIFDRIAKDGYSAIECLSIFSYQGKPLLAAEFVRLAKKHGLDIIVQIHTGGGYFDDAGYVYCGSYTVQDHLDSLSKELDLALLVEPSKINVHAGVDAWEQDKQIEFLLGAVEIAQSKHVKDILSMETHRQRIFGTPFSTREILKDPRIQAVSYLRFTADLSHWVVACERQLTDSKRDPWFTPLLEEVGRRTALIHCRVGHAQGPQVADVTDQATHEADVQAHLEMWNTLWQEQRKIGAEAIWCEVEHGPPPYLNTLPHTGQPVADLWKVNNDVANLVRDKFNSTLSNQ